MSAPTASATGIKYGIIAGFLYVVLLILQYSFTADNPINFSATKFISYLLIIAVFVRCALAHRKNLGGYTDFRSLVHVLTITIIITELFYSVFNFIYLKFIDPQFIDNLINNFMLWFERKGIPEDQIDAQLGRMREKTGDPLSLKNNVLGLAQSIVFDGIIAFIIAAVLKKPKPPFEHETINS